MKTRYFYLILILTTIIIWNCQEDPIMPDPGFDTIADRYLAVRRDTANSYVLSLNVIAPAGVNVIQVLDGRTYSIIERYEEFRGKKEFPFEYQIDFEHLDPNVDTTLMFNIQVISLDNKSYNVSFGVNVIKLSRPELLMKDDIYQIATNTNTFILNCHITTGMYKLKSIKAVIGDSTILEPKHSEIKDSTDFIFKDFIIDYNVEEGETHIMTFFIEDERGMKAEYNIELIGLILKRPYAIDVMSSMGNYEGSYLFKYDEKYRMTEIEYIRQTTIYRNHKMNFMYNDAGMVYRIEYTDEWDEDEFYYIDFEYDNDGRLVRAKHELYDDWYKETFDVADLKNFTYRENGTVYSFDYKATTFNNVVYGTTHSKNNPYFAEKWPTYIERMSLDDRLTITGITSILNPLYVKGLPPFWYPHVDIKYLMNLLFYKFIYENDAGHESTSDPNDLRYSYRYSIDDENCVTSFSILRYGWIELKFRY